MARYDADLLVIGGGAAGLTVAAGAARLAAKVVLVEREPQLGGDCLHYGCVPSKALLATAHTRQRMLQAEAYGLPPVEVPPVSFPAVAARIRQVQAVIQQHDSVERFTGLGADVRFGDARFCDPHTVEVDGKRISAARIVIATGSSAAIPPVEGLAGLGATAGQGVPYLTNRDIFSLAELPDALVILGGGPVAVEMAQAFARLGSRVTLIQRGAEILSRDDPDMAQVVRQSLERDGVRVLCGMGVRAVKRTPSGGVLVGITDGAGVARMIEGDKLLVVLGRAPNVAGLGLDAAGVTHSPKGIAVDARMRTSQPHIYAAGDVTGAYQFTHAAGHEGSTVVANAVLRLPRKASYRWMPWCTYTEPELAGMGLNERAAHEQGVDVTVHTEAFAHNDRALAESSPEGRIKLVLARDSSKVLGVQIVGPHAGDLLNTWVVALNGGVKLTTLAGAVMPYPTLGEISRRAAGSIVSEPLFSDNVRSVLCTLFRYRGKGC